MSKINHKEYEILKNLDDKRKWIVRNEDRGLYAFTKKPVRKDGPSSYWRDADGWDAEPCSVLGLIDEIYLFQFIQWFDEEPYNVQELIEEYEYHNELVKLAGGLSITQAKFDKYLKEHINELESESKERELSLGLAHIYGYEMEEEQKYYARIKGHELVSDSEDGYWNVDGEELYIDTIWHDYSGYKTTKLTKDEWEKLGINEHNADFVLA